MEGVYSKESAIINTMPTTFNDAGKPTYMYDSVGDVWYAVGAKIDTASGYEWGGAQTFLNTVTTDATVVLRDGFNNFLNPAARDAAITAPVRGTIAFVRQDAGGTALNQIQYYNGSAWVANDGDISGVTAGSGMIYDPELDEFKYPTVQEEIPE